MKVAIAYACALLLSIVLANISVGNDQIVRVASARLLDSPTVVSDGMGNSISAQGYLELELESRRDLIGLAKNRDASLWSSATACRSKLKLMGWPYLYPGSSKSGVYTYLVLIGYKDVKHHAYNLAEDDPVELCVTVGLGTMNLLRASRFSVPPYRLDRGLLDSLVAYDKQNGEVKLKLSPECESHMCIPQPSSQIQ
jgi:hypothetical protein